jgi:hypothetical protein
MVLNNRTLVAVLVDEHHRIMSTIEDLLDGGAASTARRTRLAEQTYELLDRHVSAEQRYLLPSVRSTRPDGDRVVEMEQQRDRHLLAHARQLPSQADRSQQFDELLREIDTLVRQHVYTCSMEIFPPLVALTATTSHANSDLMVGRATYPRPRPPSPRRSRRSARLFVPIRRFTSP